LTELLFIQKVIARPCQNWHARNGP